MLAGTHESGEGERTKTAAMIWVLKEIRSAGLFCQVSIKFVPVTLLEGFFGNWPNLF
jgi:hypothetical protein